MRKKALAVIFFFFFFLKKKKKNYSQSLFSHLHFDFNVKFKKGKHEALILEPSERNFKIFC